MDAEQNKSNLPPWKILIADDDKEIHSVSRMILTDLELDNRPVEILDAYSARQAQSVIASEPDIALVVLDVVMETETSGLDLVRCIRGELENRNIRIILRTGKPGLAPESRVIIEYDINDYKEKTELSAQKLKTSVISALRSYRDLLRLETSTRNLAEAESFLASVISSLSSVLIVTDDQLRIVEWNPTAERYLAAPPQKAKGRLLFDLVPEMTVFSKAIHAAAEGIDDTRTIDFRYSREKEEYIFSLNIYSLQSETAKGVILLLTDMTEKMRVEEQLRRSQKLEALGSLSAGLAHDVNNALGGITGSVSLIEYEKEARPDMHNPAYDEYLATIKHSTGRASTMVRHLLSLTKKEELKQERVDLIQALNHVVKICRTSFDKRINIAARYSLEEAFILGDSSQLEQVFLNLAINGYHAMTIMRPDSERWEGTLLLGLSEIESEDGMRYRVTVRDTGVGIKEPQLEKIFDPFFTTKQQGEGTGLGLATVYNIVTYCRGTINVVSKPGEGSTFTLEFPVYAFTADEEKERDEVHIPAGSGTVLLCDDDILMRKIGEKILEKTGYTVITADDGEEACSVFNENKERIQLVILDYQMPKMSGLDAFLKMKELDPDVKALLTSGYRSGDKIEAALELGINGFLQKPYTMQDLAVSVKNIVAGG